ncbi:MAG: hypothetical protein B7Y17_07355, partial [Sulfuricurvum sp. 24-42-5]
IGGKNALLKLLETIRNTSPHPLISKTALLRFPKGLIKWNKNVHRDNLSLLSSRMNARTDENPNLMVSKEDKSYKNVANMLRSLGPLTFTVAMNKEEDGLGFNFKAFEIVDSDTTLMTPMFELFFFCSVSITKKIINYAANDNTGIDNAQEDDETL